METTPKSVPAPKPPELVLRRRHARIIEAAIRNKPALLENISFPAYFSTRQSRKLSEEQAQELWNIGVDVSFNRYFGRNYKSIHLSFSDDFLSGTDAIYVHSFSSTFVPKDFFSAAFKALRKSAWLMPLGKLLSEWESTSFTEAARNTYVAISSVQPIAFVSEHPGLSLGIAVIGSIPLKITYSYAKKRSAAKQLELQQNKIVFLPTPINFAERATSDMLSIYKRHGIKAVGIIAACVFLGQLAKNSATSAFSNFWHVFTGAVFSGADALMALGWAVPATILSYKLFKLRIERAGKVAEPTDNL